MEKHLFKKKKKKKRRINGAYSQMARLMKNLSIKFQHTHTSCFVQKGQYTLTPRRILLFLSLTFNVADIRLEKEKKNTTQ